MMHKVKRNVAAMGTHTIENAEVQDYRQRLEGAAKALKTGLEETAATERNWTSLVGSNFVNFADRYVRRLTQCMLTSPTPVQEVLCGVCWTGSPIPSLFSVVELPC